MSAIWILQLNDPIRDASFHASQLRDPPPHMELKSARDLFSSSEEDMSFYISNYFKIYGDLDITAGGGTDGMPEKHIKWLQKRIRNCKEKHGRRISATSSIIHGGLLERLDKRLQEVADKGQIPTWRPSTVSGASTEPHTPRVWSRAGFSKDKEIQKREHAWFTEMCNRLEEDGGQLFVHVNGLNEIKGDVWRLAEDIHPWRFALGIPKNRPSDVFEQQLATWEFFRRWQRYNRGLQDTGGFEELVIHFSRKKLFMGTEAENNEFLKDIRSDNPSVLKEEWEQEQLLRVQLQRHWREDCESFDDYGAAVERRLAKHGIHKTFKPNIDARSQDPVTTWTEYLGHMFWVYDVHKDHYDEMLAENELYVATLTFEDRNLDRDDPDWEANLEKAQRGLDQAKENHQRFVAMGQSKGSIFWQPYDMRDMKSMVSCTKGLAERIQTRLRLLELRARSPSDDLHTEASLEGATNTVEETTAVALQEGSDDGTILAPPQGQNTTTPPHEEVQEDAIPHPQPAAGTQFTSPLHVSGSPISRSLKRKGSFSEQTEHNTNPQKRSRGQDPQPAQALRRSERIPEVQRRKAEAAQKAKEEEARKAKEKEEARKARAEKKAMKFQAEKEKRQDARAAKTTRVPKATNSKHTQPTRRSTRVIKRPRRFGFASSPA
ncbi:unnamed protein product [Clonostachys rosea]|uniref:Uncharacterized protein n=1 Tax=Bionectria ochroleuca TaxID=29856 RepID=A0ABY6U4B7_BIOOC|nr:unnamed protein product [Clonostachys rosea]